MGFNLKGGITGAIGGFITGGPAGAIAGGALGAMSEDPEEQYAQAGAEARAAADPFAGERSFYQGKLRSLYGGDTGSGGIRGLVDGAAGMAGEATGTGGPGYIRNLPGYQFAQEEAMRGVTRTHAAKGLLRSGNLLFGLQERAAGLASQTYGEEVGRLMKLSGVDAGQPGVAGQLGYKGGIAGIGAGQQQQGALGYGITRALDYFGGDEGALSYDTILGRRQEFSRPEGVWG